MREPAAPLFAPHSSLVTHRSPLLTPLLMGKGDKKTRKGKIYRGSYGKARPKKRESQRKARSARTARRLAGAASARSR